MSSIKIRTKRSEAGTQIRTLISHPMENGRNKDKNGQIIPAHFIQELLIEYNGEQILTSHLAGGISRNPYFDFLLKQSQPGDVIRVSWVDNLGQQDTKSHIIK